MNLTYRYTSKKNFSDAPFVSLLEFVEVWVNEV